jgi:DNA-binding transcriptional ArsR family regulator
MLNKENKMALGETMRALSDPTRREILSLLKEERLSAGDISEHFEISAAAVSRHLSVLKDADLVRDRRDGKFVYYELNASVLEEILLWVAYIRGGSDD